MSEDPDDLDDLVEGWLALREDGAAPTPAEYAARHPRRADALLRALEDLTTTENLLPRPAAEAAAFGRWRTMRLLGAGGSGVVFEAVARDDPRLRAAVKALSPGRAPDARARERLRREARVLAESRHPNVVGVIEADADAPTPWIAMEFVEGPTLRARLDAERAADAGAGPASREAVAERARSAARVGLALAEALAWAHARGLVHRDVKPSNVVVRADGSPVLLDFGLAVDDDATTLTRTGDVLGTPAYMAPEQARGERVGPSADVYGLGATLFELVAHEPPRVGGDSREMLAEARVLPARRLRDVLPHAPRAFADLVDAALAPTPERRPASAEFFAEELRRVLAGEAVRSRPPTAWERLRRRVRARPARAFAAVALVATAALGALLAARSLDARRTRAAAAKVIERAAGILVEPGAPGLESAARELAALEPGSETAALLLEIARGERPTSRSDPVVAAFVAAELAVAAGDAAAGLAALRPTLSRDEPSTLAWAFVVRVERALRDAATADLPEPPAAAPGRPGLATVRGKLLVRRGRFDEAARAFAAARADGGDASRLAFAEAEARDRAGDVGLAKAAALAGGVDVAVLWARRLDRDKRRSEARDVLAAAIAAAPDHVEARFRLATSFAADEAVVEAVAELREALRRAPAHAPSLVTLAWLHAWVCGHEACKVVRDPDAAMAAAAAALRADGGRERAIVLTATRVARHLDRRAELIEVLRSLAAERRARGEDVSLLEDGVRELEGP